MDAAIARNLGDLALAAQAAAQSLAEAVARETLRLGSEKARLEALLSDVPVGVILCSADHALVFYNGPAADIIGTSRGLEAGLDRKLFDYVHAAPLQLAHERLVATGDPDAVSDLLCTTTTGARVPAARMRLLGDGGTQGYVLTLRDITGDMAAEARREAMLETTIDSLRRPAATLTALIEVIAEDAVPPPMLQAMKDEVSRLSLAVTGFAAARDEGQAEAAALPATRAANLTERPKARLAASGIAVEARTADLILRCNGYEILTLLEGLARRLADRAEGRRLELVIDEKDSGAVIRLVWTGARVGVGDEIVQLAAVRIVNGRRVEGEVFDTLVNPGGPIPAVSTEVHGITHAMVADAPGVADVVRRFHKFAEGAVLIAHNAPFDMEFLRRVEEQLGVSFDMPVLGTVLLSAVVYGQHEVHSLDALSHRLGSTIPEEDRHTALGDAIATADAFLKLVPMLASRGLEMFGAVLTEVRKHGRLLKDLN